MSDLKDKRIVKHARILRICSQRAGISALESWDAIGTHRRARWMQLAEGVLDEGYVVIPSETLRVLRGLAGTSSYEPDTEALNALHETDEVLGPDPVEENESDAEEIATLVGGIIHELAFPNPDMVVSYMRFGDLVSVALRGLKDMELHQVILGLWTKLGSEARTEVLADLIAMIQQKNYMDSPIVSAFHESTGQCEVIDLNKFMPRGGIQPK